MLLFFPLFPATRQVKWISENKIVQTVQQKQTSQEQNTDISYKQKHWQQEQEKEHILQSAVIITSHADT